MLLSLLLSFILARKLRGTTYVPLMMVFISSVSFFSAFGWLGENEDDRPIAPINPLPLSFPLYASTNSVNKPTWSRPPWVYDVYEINVLTTRIDLDFPPLTLNKGILAYSLFLLANTVGVIIGYWIGKSAILEKFFRRALFILTS